MSFSGIDYKGDSKAEHNNQDTSCQSIASTNYSHTVILLDVDQTLLLGVNGRYNEALINALVLAEMKKVCLFTSMSMKEIVFEIADEKYVSRPKLISDLKKIYGIEVTSVMTPADVSYNKKPGAIYDELFLKHHKRIRSGKSDQLIDDNYKTDDSFQHDYKAYEEHHQNVCKRVMSTAKSEKSELFEYFLRHKSSTVNHVLMIDDAKKHLDAVAHVCPKEMFLNCVYVNKKGGDLEYFIKMLLPNVILAKKIPKQFIARAQLILNQQAEILLKDGNYLGVSRLLEIEYYISCLAGHSKKDLIKKINEARVKSKVAGFFDNLEIDNFYKQIMNSDPYFMRLKKIELSIDLFILKSDKQASEVDFDREVLNPLISFILTFKDEASRCYIVLLERVKSLLTQEKYEGSLKKIENSIRNETVSQLLQQHGLHASSASLINAYEKDSPEDKQISSQIPKTL